MLGEASNLAQSLEHPRRVGELLLALLHRTRHLLPLKLQPLNVRLQLGHCCLQLHICLVRRLQQHIPLAVQLRQLGVGGL